MAEQEYHSSSTLALNTKVEDDFVAPLTTVRGSLEILRDFKDLSEDERHNILERALKGCAHLEKSINDLANSVYTAGQETHLKGQTEPVVVEVNEYASRLRIFDDLEVMEVDFSDFTFSSSKIVNDFYDTIEDMISETGRNWYFLVNYRDCSIWPEAWIAFAHRGKKINVTCSLGTVHYVEYGEDHEKATDAPLSDSYDPNLFNSRAEALARIEELKAGSAS